MIDPMERAAVAQAQYRADRERRACAVYVLRRPDGPPVWYVRPRIARPPDGAVRTWIAWPAPVPAADPEGGR